MAIAAILRTAAAAATAATVLHAAAAADSVVGARVSADGAGWPQICTPSGGYSAYNTTACPTGATCCANGFSMSGQGCCPFDNAV
jgi:hypothetical protein